MTDNSKKALNYYIDFSASVRKVLYISPVLLGGGFLYLILKLYDRLNIFLPSLQSPSSIITIFIALYVTTSICCVIFLLPAGFVFFVAKVAKRGSIENVYLYISAKSSLIILVNFLLFYSAFILFENVLSINKYIIVSILFFLLFCFLASFFEATVYNRHNEHKQSIIILSLKELLVNISIGFLLFLPFIFVIFILPTSNLFSETYPIHGFISKNIVKVNTILFLSCLPSYLLLQGYLIKHGSYFSNIYNLISLIIYLAQSIYFIVGSFGKLLLTVLLISSASQLGLVSNSVHKYVSDNHVAQIMLHADGWSDYVRKNDKDGYIIVEGKPVFYFGSNMVLCPPTFDLYSEDTLRNFDIKLRNCPTVPTEKFSEIPSSW